MRRRRPRRWLKILALALLITGGVLLHLAWPFIAYPVTVLDIERKAPLPAENIRVPLAGIAEVDITPPVGIPKFGYSAWSRPADGFRTRLRAKAFYLHAPDSTPLALVTLDLGAGSRVLHHRVAEIIAAETDVPAHGLSLLVTHTHSGPGQYLDSDFYNVFGSDSPGFDPQLAEFLSQRIAAAVISAYQQRRAARFASGQTDIWGLTRNRSIEAWARNFDLPEEQVTEALALQAVNPAMTMLRIDLEADDGRFYPAGALTAFSIHGTAIPAFTRPWHADVWAWLGQDVARGIQSRYDTPFTPVHGAYQATHADNNPAWVEGLRGDREARRIGEALATRALALFDTLGEDIPGQEDAALTTWIGTRQLNLLTLTDAERFGICERAAVGAATAGAAKGDEVFPISWLPYLQHGWPRRIFTEGCHGTKQWMLSRLQRLLPAERFPHEALFQVIRINDLVLVAVPWEVTLESGNVIREAVLAELPQGDWTVEISSLANGFFGYVTTPAEYGIQYYEGGHTLYGPGTLGLLAGQSAILTRDLVREGEIQDLPDRWQFALRSRAYWPDTALDPAPRSLLSAPVFSPAETGHEAFWAFRFAGEHPAYLQLEQPLLQVEVDAGNGWQPLITEGVRVNDQGTDLQLRMDRETDTGAEYTVRWFNPLPPAPDQRFRIRVAPRPVGAEPSQRSFYSPAF
ncbi:neutral/alkaline non-lysosomal ceramidase N-terminal domain-containing protein [Alcanivorax sp. JB21]|uniref:neutral/alkaline non-lysosomal ceramidase N-terminal domain-containing protein n=1 Tax=Alcanivorax limicola TaxID=2874102 RepID=UPI001CBB0C60|nr:neutral/alkaline non-lysosomal ceramidase N-terminal domain-containing protein [Alcanivorax limicola]MBZ2187578.1 neutral/alkaline non-lysosomal ceramidase N-terminal domain-containing protein [Alcanivorax limicola]